MKIYNMIRWFPGPMGQTTRLIDQVSDVPSIFFFHNFLLTWGTQKGFCKEFCKIWKKKIIWTWKIRRLVNNSFVPSSNLRRPFLFWIGFSRRKGIPKGVDETHLNANGISASIPVLNYPRNLTGIPRWRKAGLSIKVII